MSRWNGLERRTPLRRTPFKKKAKEKDAARKKPVPSGLKRRPHSLVDELDRVFSLYVRLRDAMPGGRTVCISCGKVFPFEVMQAGHFFSRRSFSTRWCEVNVWSQCAECNCVRCGNLERYRERLIEKIGADALDGLDYLHNQTRRWSNDELEEKIAYYKELAVALSRKKCINVKI